jgi:soluble lytic murein transglycosylase-like protein
MKGRMSGMAYEINRGDRKHRRIGMLAVKGIYRDGKIEPVESLPSEIKEADVYIVIVPKPKKESDDDFFDYNLDDAKEKIAWAVTSANAVSEWKNPEEDEVWK